jgi:hypothetical protein
MARALGELVCGCWLLFAIVTLAVVVLPLTVHCLLEAATR